MDYTRAPLEKNLRCLNWNIRGLHARRHELADFAKTHKLHILFITETFCKKIPPPIAGYKRVFKNRPVQRGGGVAMYIRNNIHFDEINTVTKGIETVGIRLHNTNLYTVYNRPNHVISDIDLQSLFRSHKVALVGDFNARHIMFGDRVNNHVGNALTRSIFENNFHVFSPHTSTRFHANTGGSILDMVIAKNLQIYNMITHSDLSSDHLPVTFVLNTEVIPIPPREIRDYQNTNWPLFRQRLNDNIQIKRNITCIAEIDEAVSYLTEQIQKTIRREIPTVTINSRGLCVTEEIRNL